MPAASTAITPRIGLVEDMHLHLCLFGCEVEIRALRITYQVLQIAIKVLVSRLQIVVVKHSVIRKKVFMRLNFNRVAPVEDNGNHQDVESENNNFALF